MDHVRLARKYLASMGVFVTAEDFWRTFLQSSERWEDALVFRSPECLRAVLGEEEIRIEDGRLVRASFRGRWYQNPEQLALVLMTRRASTKEDAKHNKKSDRLEKLRKSYQSLEKQVRKDIRSKDTKTRLTALVAALIDDTYERVGNDASAKDGHYGVTGWCKKHVKLKSGSVVISYVGKSGVSQVKTVTDPILVKELKALVKDKDPDDWIFSAEGVRATARDVNGYLEQFKITAKDLRGYHANEEMKKALKARKGTDYEGNFKKCLKTVAKLLGHLPTTLQNQYLVPALEKTYLRDGTILDKLDTRKSEV